MKITLLKSFLMLGAFLCFGLAKAQTVSGTVSDATGPLPGASVLVKGTTNGTQTDFDGNYTLDGIEDSSVLVFSYIGYKTVEVGVNGRSTVNVTLEEDAQALDEVVIIGYGQTTIKDATGAVAAVTSEDFNGGIISSPEQLIQGKTAGVQITQASGEPGAGIALRIRGTTSVRSNNNPLFVVDGIPLTSDTAPESGNIGFGTSGSKNPLAFLNPSDIESMSILKDASATAIYGSRGANGVVIITTKSGKGSQGGVFEFNSTLSISNPANDLPLLGREAFLDAVEQFGGDRVAQDAGYSTNWQDVVTRRAVSQNQNITYSNNYGKGNIRATFGYGKQFGIVQNSSMERITGRVNWGHRFLDDKLRLNLQGTMSRVNDESPALSGSAGFRGDLLGAAYSANPTWPSNPEYNSGGQLNPRVLTDYIQSLSNTNRALINFSAEYDFTPELTGKINLGYDKSEATRNAVASSLGRNLDRGTFGNGRGAINNLDIENRLIEATLNYKKEFENSNLDAIVGFSFQDFANSGRNARGFGFATTDLNEMSDHLNKTVNVIEQNIDGRYQQYGYAPNTNGVFVNRLVPDIVTDNLGTITGTRVNSLFVDTFDTTDELQSFFARVNYTIADKYLFTATVRADGSSRFGGNNQYGYFPSAAFAWKLNEEDFIGDSVSTLKLRLSFGITGNQDGLGHANYIFRSRYAVPDQVISDGGDINIPGTETVAFPNDDLKWEETVQYGVGLDFGFGNDRLNGSVDFYRKDTQDVLLRVNSAQPAPQQFFFGNFDSSIINQGVEFSINYDLVQSADFNWSAGLNVAYNDNQIKKLRNPLGGQVIIPSGQIRGQGLSNAFSQRLEEGQPLFAFFLRQFEGYDGDGQPIFTGGIDNQVYVGETALPDITGGFSTNLSYKNWDLSAYLSGQFGAAVYNNTANAFFTAGAIQNARNVTPDVPASNESGLAEASVSTRFLESADFVRLQNLTLGYNVPLSGDNVLKSLRLSVTGQNLFLITDYSGLDPEVSVTPGNSNGSTDLLNGIPIAGIDYTAFPRPRTFTIGLNATF